MKILFIDNYDSFTYNLVQLVGLFTTDLTIKRNNKISIGEINALNPDKIIISPGPGTPEDSGISIEAIKYFGRSIPILGVCLGHQAIGYSYGAKIIHAPSLMHGKPSAIKHDGKNIYNNIPQNFFAGRYHSLIIDRSTISSELTITAETEDGIIMGVRHKTFPVEGIQFHPESILTEQGNFLIKNWVES